VNTKSLVPGVIADVITPFSANGEIDMDALQREVKLLENSAVDGLCVGGMLSGMEGTLPEELSSLCGAVRRGSKKPLFTMLFPDTTLEAVEMIRAVEDAGADVVLVAQPHYLSLPSEEGLAEMFADLKKVTRGPLLLADCFVNGMVGVATTKHLAGKHLVDGVFQSADVHVLVDLLYSQLGVPVYSGVEDLHYVAFALGARGVISDLASLFPGEASEVYRSFHEGKHAEARSHHERLVRLWRALGRYAEGEGRVRVALEAQGRKVGPAPSPYNKIPANAAGEVRSALQREGLASA
jgi:4-hydroxy-tetrahydrodipicolinate synthase